MPQAKATDYYNWHMIECTVVDIPLKYTGREKLEIPSDISAAHLITELLVSSRPRILKVELIIPFFV